MFIENVIKVFDLGNKALRTRNFGIVFLRVCASIASIIRLKSVSLRLSRRTETLLLLPVGEDGGGVRAQAEKSDMEVLRHS